MTHDHKYHNDCFYDAALERDNLKLYDDRVGHFIIVRDSNDKGTAHFLGNTAFGGGCLKELITSVLAGHEDGKCLNCDRVAFALRQARDAYQLVMDITKGKC